MKTKQTAITVAVTALIAAVSALLIALIYDGNRAPAIVIEDAPYQAEIAVSVEGAVRNPGVYRLNGDARLVDVIDAAGGFAPDADVSGLNMAARLTDEQRILIPTNVTTGTSPVAAEPDRGAAVAEGAIDINTADVEMLDRLPGIGPVIAQRIVDYRETHGPFTRVEELARVEGISPGMVEELGDQIRVGP